MRSKEILIIEDEPPYRKAIKFALHNSGYTFFEAGSVSEGISELDEHPDIRVILLDLSLGEKETGRGFLEQIRERASQYRIIILTEHEEKLVAEQAREFGVFTYLPKATRAFTQSIRFSVEQAFKDIEKELLEEERERLTRENEFIFKKTEDLLAIQLKINSDEPLNEILSLICDSLRKLVGAYTCHIRVYNLKTGDFDLAAFAGPSEGIRSVLNSPKRKGDLFSCKAAVTKRPRLFKNLQDYKGFKDFREGLLKRPTLSEEARTYLYAIKEAYIAPITTNMFADETDAIFNIGADSIDFFSEEKQKVINEFVTQATIAITKAWQKQRKTETHQDYQNISKVLEKISKTLSEENSKEEIYDIVINGIAEIVRPETIVIFLHNKDTNLLDNKAEFVGNRRVTPRSEGHPTNIGLTGYVFNEGKPLRIPNLQSNDRRSPQEYPSYSEVLEKSYLPDVPSKRAKHYLGIPMQIGGEIIGVIQLLNKKSDYHGRIENKQCWLLERGFSDDCEGVMGIAASYLAVAIKNAELIEERNRKIRQLDTLKDVGRYTSSEMPLDELLDKIIEEAANDIQAEICLLFLLNEGKTHVVLEQSYGIPKEHLRDANNKDAHYAIGQGLTGGVAKTGKSVLKKADIPSGNYDDQIVDHLRQIYGKGKAIESLMVVPIKAKDEVIGVIKAINKKGDVDQYNQEDLSFFETFANYVGIAIENAQRYKLTNEELTIAAKNVALSHLVRAVVHEINNTKALIPINVEIIRDRMSNSNYDIKEMIDVIEDSAKQAVKFANSIQAFSSSKLGEREAQDINAIINKAIQQLAAGFERDKKYQLVKLEPNLASDLPTCSVYETPFIQVIQNIVLNAYQAMEESKEKLLTITSYKDEKNNLVKIDFTDTGHGIESEILEKIFNPEFTTKEGKGTGIGLWLARTHLNSIEAEIKVDSVVNKGTTFTIEIPVSEADVT
ncbi:MAG TPA: GAF domain-containing protein [Pyrinomonadaceae bacterium]|nr:GAF domain-containing protein [Pyrinomonadaceae bacterium]